MNSRANSIRMPWPLRVISVGCCCTCATGPIFGANQNANFVTVLDQSFKPAKRLDMANVLVLNLGTASIEIQFLGSVTEP